RERLLHRRDAALHVEELNDVFLGDNEQRLHVNSEPTSSRSAGERSSARASRTGSRWAGVRGPTTTDVTPGWAMSQPRASPAMLTPRSAAAAPSASSAAYTRSSS